MIPGIPGRSVPSWLSGLNPRQVTDGAIPLGQMLEDSLYYPASKFDGDPVKYLAGSIFSFVYVDFAVGRNDLCAELEDPGFRGYRLFAKRDVRKDELCPRGWEPLPLMPRDGRPPTYPPKGVEPFASWVIEEREPEFAADHGPARFSLLYLCGDGAMTYQALFHANGCRPKVIAIVQPGTGFGGNWTSFEDPELIMARSVELNPGGVPEYLMYGGWGDPSYYAKPCWPVYSELVRRMKGGRLGLWRRPGVRQQRRRGVPGTPPSTRDGG